MGEWASLSLTPNITSDYNEELLKLIYSEKKLEPRLWLEQTIRTITMASVQMRPTLTNGHVHDTNEDESQQSVQKKII